MCVSEEPRMYELKKCNLFSGLIRSARTCFDCMTLGRIRNAARKSEETPGRVDRKGNVVEGLLAVSEPGDSPRRANRVRTFHGRMV